MLNHIETRLGIRLPAVYHEMAQWGMLGWPQVGHDAEARLHPPLLWAARDFRVLATSELEAFAARVRCTDARFVQTLPFGRTGAGDLYYLAWSQPEAEPMICLLNKTTDVSRPQAASLADFVVCQLMLAVSDIDEDELEADPDAFEADLSVMLRSHAFCLTAPQQAALYALYARPFQSQGDGTLSKLDEAEYTALHARLLPTPFPRESFGSVIYTPMQALASSPRLV